MSWQLLAEPVRAAAVAALTEKQLEAWKLELAGYGLRRIGWELDLSRGAVADRIAAAHLNLRRAGVWQDASGNWHLNTEEAA